MGWQIDRRHSYVGFSVKHMKFVTVRGQFHEYEGHIQLDPEDLTRSHFEGTIQVASLDTHEAQRDAHLRSAEFFDVARYPTLSYHSKRIEALSNGRFRVTGDLTLHGVTHEVTVEGEYAGSPTKDPWGELRTGFSATGTLNRKDFGLAWNVGLEAGGFLVSDEVTMQLDIELVQAASAT